MISSAQVLRATGVSPGSQSIPPRSSTKRGAASRVPEMMLPTLGAFIGGTLGWYLGALAGTGTAFVLSIVGSAFGGYAGKQFKARLGA